MKKLLKVLKISSIIILGGMLIPALLSIVFSGFRIDAVSIISFVFVVGIIIALLGGVMIITDFSRFRKKVLKTPADLEVSEDEDEERINWANLLFYTGLIIVLAAIAIGEII